METNGPAMMILLRSRTTWLGRGHICTKATLSISFLTEISGKLYSVGCRSAQVKLLS